MDQLIVQFLQARGITWDPADGTINGLPYSSYTNPLTTLYWVKNTVTLVQVLDQFAQLLATNPQAALSSLTPANIIAFLVAHPVVAAAIAASSTTAVLPTAAAAAVASVASVAGLMDPSLFQPLVPPLPPLPALPIAPVTASAPAMAAIAPSAPAPASATAPAASPATGTAPAPPSPPPTGLHSLAFPYVVAVGGAPPIGFDSGAKASAGSSARLKAPAESVAVATAGGARRRLRKRRAQQAHRYDYADATMDYDVVPDWDAPPTDPVAGRACRCCRTPGRRGNAQTSLATATAWPSVSAMLADCSARRCNLHPESQGSTTRVRPAMATEFNGKIELDIRDSEPDWDPFAAPSAPEGAPNVLYLVWDDTGIATWDCFGGLVEMPAMTRIAERGVRLSQFHTTALCSPTRASLLTGRNATTVGMATIEEFTDGFPNCNGRIPADTALLSEVLAEHGYNTYCVGKWHLTPLEESSMASTKRHWPTSRGFERFYGFLGGETDQWYPDLVYDNHPVNPPGTPEDGYHLSKDIADKTIEFIRDAKVIAPDKPWFGYVCPGAGHAPHHVFQEWADRYAGKFDMGYEHYREIVLDKQKSMGIVPQDTELSPVNPYLDVKGPQGEPWPLQDTVRPWDSLNDEEKKLFSRMAEVFAGFLSYTDAQIGRILDYLEESGQLDNTVVVVISDNGASGEGGPNGSVNEGKFFNGYIDTVEESMKVFDHLGGPETYNHYPIGWAMAFNTPYKLYKRYASHEGGIADTAIISWPNGIAAHGEMRDNYVNVADITPTLYDLINLTPPEFVKGIAQKPLDGVSFKAALDDPSADTGKQTQFYTMLGTRGVWHEGWFANTVHAASPAGWGHFDADRWELFHIDADRSQCHDLAGEHPDKLEELKALWFSEAAKYNGLPLADLNIFETLARTRPYLVSERDSYIYYPDCADVATGAAAEIRGRSFAVLADVTIDSTGAEGVLFKHGGAHGGHVLFVQDGRLHYVYNFLGERQQLVSSSAAIPLGRHVFGVRYARTGTVQNSHTPLGDVTLFIDDATVGTLADVQSHPGTFGLAGVGITVGRNGGSAVSSRYKAPFAFTGGTIAQVTVDLSGRPYEDVEKELALAFSRD